MTPVQPPKTPASDEHVLLVGHGYVGTAAARMLAATGRRVTAVKRTVGPRDLQEARDHGVTLLAADVLTDDGLDLMPGDADVIILAIAPGGREVARYQDAYVAAPRRVTQHQQRPPRLVLMTTSTAVYDADDGSWVTEDLPVTAPTPTSAAMHEGELALPALAAHSVALRLGGIYGPGRERLVKQVLAGSASCSPDNWTNRIHRDDAARAITHLVLRSEPPPPILNVVDDRPAKRCEVLTWLAAQLGAPTPGSDAPAVGGRRSGSKRVSNRLLHAVGWDPVHPSYVEGYAATIARRRSDSDVETDQQGRVV
ncbi:MAG: nucleoside-diphosphate-sugar epimerase [Glaciecola sp.]|jgi:nucleoside-diphosphate-sugar epimerase